MTTLSANFHTTLDRALEKELGKATVHTMVADKSKPNTVNVIIHTDGLKADLEKQVASAVKKALKAEAYAIMFNSPKKFTHDSITYFGKFVIRWPTVKEDTDLPLLRDLIESSIPKMIAPGIKVSVPQAMRDKLMAAMKKLNYVPEGSAYSDGSTSWTAIAAIGADFNHDKFVTKLRRALGDFEGELNVRYYDLAEE
jgi:hypothetical protein